jgi:hypothetical protein
MSPMLGLAYLIIAGVILSFHDPFLLVRLDILKFFFGLSAIVNIYLGFTIGAVFFSSTYFSSILEFPPDPYISFSVSLVRFFFC